MEDQIRPEERVRELDLDPVLLPGEVDPRSPDGIPAPVGIPPPRLRTGSNVTKKVPPCAPRRAREILQAASQKPPLFDLGSCTVAERRACLIVLLEQKSLTQEQQAALFSVSTRTVEKDWGAIHRAAGKMSLTGGLEEEVGRLEREAELAKSRLREKDPKAAWDVQRELTATKVALGVVGPKRAEVDLRVTLSAQADAVDRTVKTLTSLNWRAAGLVPKEPEDEPEAIEVVGRVLPEGNHEEPDDEDDLELAEGS